MPRAPDPAHLDPGILRGRETAEAVQVASEDRRLAKTHVSVHMGGAAGGRGALPGKPDAEPDHHRDLAAEVRRCWPSSIGWRECCDAGTKVIMIGRTNDVLLYRELLKRGVSEYLVAPIKPLQLMESISNLYNDPETDPVGNVIAFIGAKGGVGSSTICHNIAWTHVGDAQERTSSSPTSTSRSARPASTSTRIPCRASRKPCRARSASTRCCSTAC